MDAALLLSVVATAAAVSTAVAAGVTRWLRLRERAEPEWVTTGLITRLGDNPYSGAAADAPVLHCTATAINAGDGTAYHVTVDTGAWEGSLFRRSAGDGLSGGMSARLGHVGLVKPGEQVQFWLNCAEEDWERAGLVIEWTGSPTRKRKRVRHKVFLREIAKLPEKKAGSPGRPR
jgi:hypothetical protein